MNPRKTFVANPYLHCLSTHRSNSKKWTCTSGAIMHSTKTKLTIVQPKCAALPFAQFGTIFFSLMASVAICPPERSERRAGRPCVIFIAYPNGCRFIAAATQRCLFTQIDAGVVIFSIRFITWNVSCPLADCGSAAVVFVGKLPVSALIWEQVHEEVGVLVRSWFWTWK